MITKPHRHIKTITTTTPKGTSNIHIAPSKKGTFKAMAAKAGKSVPAEAAAVLSNPMASPVAKKKANFAKNASTWNKGGAC